MQARRLNSIAESLRLLAGGVVALVVVSLAAERGWSSIIAPDSGSRTSIGFTIPDLPGLAGGAAAPMQSPSEKPTGRLPVKEPIAQVALPWGGATSDGASGFAGGGGQAGAPAVIDLSDLFADRAPARWVSFEHGLAIPTPPERDLLRPPKSI